VVGDKNMLSAKDWEESVEKLCTGYEKALKIGEEIGLQVFFGWEYTRYPLSGTDFLTYGLNASWLAEHPEISEMRLPEYLDFIRNNGGFVSHAHPYREAAYIEMIRLLPSKVDATEVLNANRTEFENDRAAEFAQNYSLFYTYGTDNHLGFDQKKLAGMVFDRKLNNINDFITAVKEGKAELFCRNA
ncbi:MAG TPA: hypothetical protein DD733_04930, partial [Clostridiales bacterium]|nr:hypothetical protein [Clostridiales bacterium]